ncbi:MAG: YoaP domain-containing protein [Eubacteriales bacterium]|nr:YoaP domain-containing protein [Eubacteriales bacterium]MDD3882503.1 YoaP domain-containing protein [Eubacteriales bacterium]MDD4512803.1 YoaP domain-containing protein [Eubacteriales bacterium]
MEFVTITKENLAKEHICCAIASEKDAQVAAKKQWLRDRLDEGLVFTKSAERGKCFIEYIPAEKAWAPVDADGYMYINCFWTAGKFKGQGYSNQLLDGCIKDSRDKGKKGLVALSSDKKRPFLSDPSYFAHKGFTVCDSAEPFFRLMYLPFEEDAEKPVFRKSVSLRAENSDGFALYYTAQCPYTAKYVPIIRDMAQKAGAPFTAYKLDDCEKAKNAPCPFTSYSIFWNGEFVTNEILSDKRFAALLSEKGYTL